MSRLKRETLLEEVVKVLVEEGGQATMARLYYKLHNKVNLSFHEFAEEVKKSGRFVVIRPTGWENDLVALKPLVAEHVGDVNAKNEGRAPRSKHTSSPADLGERASSSSIGGERSCV